MTAIFETVKKGLDVEDSYTGFDEQILIHINSALMSLNQLGIGPSDLEVTAETTWENLANGVLNIQALKSFMLLFVKRVFDPPSTGFVLDSLNRQISELEVRLLMQVEPEEIIDVEE